MYFSASGCDFTGADFTGALLSRATFDDGQFQSARFDDAELEDASFDGAELANLRFRPRSARRTSWNKSSLFRIRPRVARTSRARTSPKPTARLRASGTVSSRTRIFPVHSCSKHGFPLRSFTARPSRARASRTRTSAPRISRKQTYHCQLSTCFFNSGTLFERTLFTQANCQGLHFVRCRMKDVEFPARSCGADRFEESHLVQANFAGAQLDEAVLLKCSARYADFVGAHAEKTDFRGSDLRETNFSEVQASAARFDLCLLEKSRWQSAQLRAASLQHVQARWADFLPGQSRSCRPPGWGLLGCLLSRHRGHPHDLDPCRPPRGLPDRSRPGTGPTRPAPQRQSLRPWTWSRGELFPTVAFCHVPSGRVRAFPGSSPRKPLGSRFALIQQNTEFSEEVRLSSEPRRVSDVRSAKPSKTPFRPKEPLGSRPQRRLSGFSHRPAALSRHRHRQQFSSPRRGALDGHHSGLVATWLGGAELTIKGPAAGLIVIALGTSKSLAGDDVLGYRRALATIVAAVVQIMFALSRSGRLGICFPPR